MMNPAESTNLIQLAALGLVGVATVILAHAQKIQMQIAQNVADLTRGVNDFREEVRDLRQEVIQVKEIVNAAPAVVTASATHAGVVPELSDAREQLVRLHEDTDGSMTPRFLLLSIISIRRPLMDFAVIYPSYAGYLLFR